MTGAALGLLHRHCQLERLDAGRYRREADRTWWGHHALFGGYVQALALAAMRTEVDRADLAPIATAIDFFRPFTDGALEVQVEVLRQGRTMANASAKLHSGGRLAGSATATFGSRRDAAPFVAAAPPRELSEQPLAPGETPVEPGVGVPTHRHFAFHPRLGGFRAGGGEARVGGWVRPRDAGPIDELLMVALADVWMPAAYHRWQEPAVAVSVNISVQFRGALPVPVDESGALFVVLRTAASVGGYVDEDGEIWSSHGELLAQSRQLRYVHA